MSPGKVGPPYGDIPFASSLRSELVVEAPSSLTSNTTAENNASKQARMESSDYDGGEQQQHREIEFSQGLPVRSSDRFR